MRRSVPANIPYQAILRAMRGQPCRENEAFLLLASRDYDPTYRAAAVSSLGWWEPVHRAEVLMSLQQARHDPNPEVRQSARAALGRLGERAALQWFRQALAAEDPQRVHEAIQVVANEGLTLLWAEPRQPRRLGGCRRRLPRSRGPRTPLRGANFLTNGAIATDRIFVDSLPPLRGREPTMVSECASTPARPPSSAACLYLPRD